MNTVRHSGFLLTAALLWGTAAEADGIDVRSSRLAIDTLDGVRAVDGRIELRAQQLTQTANAPLAIECEDAETLVFQDDVFARRGNLTVRAETIQIKRSAREYTPQADGTASGGGYIDFAAYAAYSFRMTTPGPYTVWVRHAVPFAATWMYTMSVDGGPFEVVNLAFPAPQQWYWQKGPDVTLASGVHTLAIKDLRNGKRADRIVLAPAGAAPPVDAGPPAPPLQDVTGGTVVFRPLAPGCVRAWRSIELTRQGPGGDVPAEVSLDGGGTWHTVPDDGSLAALADHPSPELTVRAALRPDANGRPVITRAAATYEIDATQLAVVGNRDYRLSFSRTTGALLGIENLRTDRSYIPFGRAQTMFELVLKQPGNPERRTVTSADARLTACTVAGGTLHAAWEVEDGTVGITLGVDVDDTPLCAWTITVTNNHPTHDVMEVLAPRLSALRIGDRPADDTLAWPFSAGEFHAEPAGCGRLEVGYPSHAGLPFVDLYTHDSGLYMASHDRFLCAMELLAESEPDKQSVTLSFRKRHRIPPGTGRTYTFVLGVHPGDWHWGARVYRDWFYGQYGRTTHPDWLRDVDAWQTGSLGNVGDHQPEKIFDPEATDYRKQLRKQFQHAAHLGLPYIQVWGNNWNGACPTYYLLRNACGGEAAVREAMQRWREVGGQIGFYFHGNAVSPYWSLAAHYFNEPWTDYPAADRPRDIDWFVRNRAHRSETFRVEVEALRVLAREVDARLRSAETVKGTNGATRGERYDPMDWYGEEFPAYVRHWVTKYVRDYHNSTAYLDTFAFWNDVPDFNPRHGHHGESNKLGRKFLFVDALITALRAHEPGFALLAEGVSDVLGTRIYHLLSGFSRNGGNIYRYTLPDQILFEGNANANWNMPASEIALMKAFLYGNRMDLIKLRSYDSYRVLRLRQRINPFLNRAVFDDRVGLTIEGGDVQAFVHRMDGNGNALVSNDGTRAVGFTFWNREEADGLRAVYRLPAGFTLNHAFRCGLYGEPTPLALTPKGGAVAFDVPADKASAVLLIERTAGRHQWTAVPIQDGLGGIRVRLLNFGTDPLAFDMSARAENTTFERSKLAMTVKGGARADAVFRDAAPRTEPRLASLSVSGGGVTRRLVMSLGAGQPYLAPPLDDLAVRDRHVLDFESDPDAFCQEDPHGGNACFRIEPKGTNTWEAKTVAFGVAPASRYRLRLALKAGRAGSKRSACYAAVTCNASGKTEIIGATPYNHAPRDGAWHIEEGQFTTRTNSTFVKVYVYNTYADTPVWFDDLVLEKAPEAPPAP